MRSDNCDPHMCGADIAGVSPTHKENMKIDKMQSILYAIKVRIRTLWNSKLELGIFGTKIKLRGFTNLGEKSYWLLYIFPLKNCGASEMLGTYNSKYSALKIESHTPGWKKKPSPFTWLQSGGHFRLLTRPTYMRPEECLLAHKSNPPFLEAQSPIIAD